MNDTLPIEGPRCRRYVDGLAAVPWDLVRDPKLGMAPKLVALVLDALSMGRAEVEARTTAIGEPVGLKRRATLEALASLEANGWIARVLVPGQNQRKFVLRWKLPDTGEGEIPCIPRGQNKPVARRPITPSFPALGMGGDP
jgi:hypothetical protein